MLGSSWLAAQLAACQERLSSVSKYIFVSRVRLPYITTYYLEHLGVFSHTRGPTCFMRALLEVKKTEHIIWKLFMSVYFQCENMNGFWLYLLLQFTLQRGNRQDNSILLCTNNIILISIENYMNSINILKAVATLHILIFSLTSRGGIEDSKQNNKKHFRI
jgi:hypothetical protein